MEPFLFVHTYTDTSYATKYFNSKNSKKKRTRKWKKTKMAVEIVFNACLKIDRERARRTSLGKAFNTSCATIEETIFLIPNHQASLEEMGKVDLLRGRVTSTPSAAVYKRRQFLKYPVF